MAFGLQSPHASSFGSKMESAEWLELVEEGTADTVEGGALKAEPEEWVPDLMHGVAGIKSIKMSARELAELERQEELEDLARTRQAS